MYEMIQPAAFAANCLVSHHPEFSAVEIICKYNHISERIYFWCRVMFCGLLFLGGNVLKKALAKLFSSHFYKATHYDKMQDALRKVCVAYPV